MTTWENDERRGETEIFISFKYFQSMIKHVERVFHNTSQTHEQTREQVFVLSSGTHYSLFSDGISGFQIGNQRLTTTVRRTFEMRNWIRILLIEYDLVSYRRTWQIM